MSGANSTDLRLQGLASRMAGANSTNLRLPNTGVHALRLDHGKDLHILNFVPLSSPPPFGKRLSMCIDAGPVVLPIIQSK
jgi:hypothetical protein